MGYNHKVFAESDLTNMSGRGLMQAVYDRHQQYPYVYEEQSMVLIDRKGNRETRKLRRYSRVEKNLFSRFLLLFDSPEDVKGVAVLAEVSPAGEVKQSVYLPAYGDLMIENGLGAIDTDFLGTDFSVEDLTGENLDEYSFRRQRDAIIEDIPYFVVDVYHLEERNRTYPLRRHYLLKENLFITRTDHFDDAGRLNKRHTRHDLTHVLGGMWRANMMLMEDHRHNHQTLIKINKRIFSADYVPAEVFTAEWLFQNSRPAEEASETVTPETELPEREAQTPSLDEVSKL